MEFIKNTQLRLELIPDPEGDLQGWEEFAHSIDGYKSAGSFKRCAELANEDTAKSLTELRCALFFVARAERHSGGFSDSTPKVRDLLRRIREKVAAKKSTRTPRDE